MLKDIFFSFKENIRQKTTNPFFGTLIIVWIIHNWKLIFTFFNFEKNDTLQGKVLFLSQYFDAKPFLLNLGSCVLSTFGVLILTYLLLNLSRLIVNWFDKKLTPLVYKITDKNSILLKSTFQNLEYERDVLSQKLENEREAKLRLQKEVSQLEERIKQLITKDDKKETLEQPITKTDAENDKMNLLLNDMADRGLNVAFNTIINTVNNHEYLDFNKYSVEANYFLQAGIIKLVDKFSHDDKFRHFMFTDFGEKVKDEFVMRNLSK
jgi:hypothetical protein